ncbi:hypothetical protein JXA80_05825 [bacterium]|nr:hypothetical protein [candidate division CSSED10-310 bacterium]
MVNRSAIRNFTLVIALLLLAACGSEEDKTDVNEREYQRKLAEAQELARKIKEGDLFNEDQILLGKIRDPGNVCILTSSYIAVDFGPSPDFRGDGLAAIFNDQSGVVYYYDLATKQRFKLFQLARDPSFGVFRSGGEQKYIFHDYGIFQVEGGTEERSLGILMNTENDWLKQPKRIYKGPATNTFLVNDDRNVIFKEEGKHYLLDEQLQKNEITEEEYKQLRDSRIVIDNKWKIANKYKGIPGVWITDPAEINWVQIRDVTGLQTVKVMPSHYAIYCWGQDFCGLLEVLPTDVPNFSIRLPQDKNAQVGDLFDVYEKKLSPISQEVIGYESSKYKGTLRVIKIVDGILVCEFQTKLQMTGIFKDDAAVSQKNSDVIGTIL